MRQLLVDEVRLGQLCNDCDTSSLRQRLETAAELARQLGPHSASGARSRLERLGCSIRVLASGIEASIGHAALLATLDRKGGVAMSGDERILLAILTEIARRKRGARLVISNVSTSQPAPDPKLLALVAKAHRARDDLFTAPEPGADRHAARLARLAYLATDITKAILEGTQPSTLTSRALLKMPSLPLAWADQRKALGFD